MPETATGRRVDLSLPQTNWPELQEIATEYAEKQQERKVVSHRLGALRGRGREQAQHEDQMVLAQAIEQSKKEEPTASKVEQVDKEIAACERRLGALEIVVDNLEQRVIEIVDQHRDAWIEEVDAELTSGSQRYAEAIEEVSAARISISQKFSLRRWLTGFPDTTYKVGGSSAVVALKAMHGDPYTFDEVMDALRQDAEMDMRDAAQKAEPLKSLTQRRHEEKQANLEAGLGYYTDDELKRLAENPIEFHHGRGAKLNRTMVVKEATDA